MKCPNCGAEIQDGAAFCPACGKATTPAQQTPPAYGYQPQQPQQPQYGYQPQQPPYGYPPQPAYPPQPVYAAPAAPRRPASPAEKEALFSTEGSIWMLIAAIVVTINVITGFIGNILSFNLLNILLVICDILIAVGFWVSFANGKKKNMSSAGLSLIRVPYIIKFVFLVIGFFVDLLVWGFTFQWISLAVGVLTFIFDCICFSSVKKTLNMGTDIARDKSVVGRKAGVFAAVVMIISATFALVSEIVDFMMWAALAEALADTPLAFLGAIMAGGGTLTIIVAAISFLASISVALVLLQFAKKIKKANG